MYTYYFADGEGRKSESYLPWRRRDMHEITGQIGLQGMVKVLEFNILSFYQLLSYLSKICNPEHPLLLCLLWGVLQTIVASIIVGPCWKRPSRLSSTALYVYPADTVYTAYTVNTTFTAYTVAHMPIYNTLIVRALQKNSTLWASDAFCYKKGGWVIPLRLLRLKEHLWCWKSSLFKTFSI